MSSVLDYSLTVKKIRLIHTGHPYTSHKENDIGEIRFVFKNPEFTCIQVDWQNGSSLSLIEGKDQYEIINEESKVQNNKKEKGQVITFPTFD
jgi:hypothetical protein